MVQERQEQVKIERAGDYERRQRVVAYTPSTRRVLVSRISMLIWLVASVVNVALVFRFVLKLIAANPANAFANLIYSVTDVLVWPFATLISVPTLASGMVLDIPALFAIVVYLIAAWVVVRLFRIIFASPGGTRQVTTVERQE